MEDKKKEAQPLAEGEAATTTTTPTTQAPAPQEPGREVLGGPGDDFGLGFGGRSFPTPQHPSG